MTIATLRWITLCNNFVPISLLVSLEMSRIAQSIYIMMDQRFKSYYLGEESGEPVRTPRIHESNLMEELGHVNHVITDKTGTLTKNEMVFYGMTD